MKDLPYFRWYPADAETDSFYAGLTDAELGFFHRCLNLSWVNFGIANDVSRLAKALRRNPSKIVKLWEATRTAWVEHPTDSSKLVNIRQEQERAHARMKSERATDAVRTRYGRTTTALARADSGSDSSVSVNSSPKDTRAEVVKFPVSHFEEFWSVYREIRGVGEEQALRVWLSFDCDSQIEQIIPCLASYAGSRDAQNGAVMNGERWLAENARDRWRARWPPARASDAVSKTDRTNAAIDRALEREARRANQI